MSPERSRVSWTCRICLSASECILYDLQELAFQDEDSIPAAYSNFTIKEAIEKMTSSKVLTAETCPRNICSICLNHVKLFLKFISKFEESENEFREKLGICSTASNCVNIIYGENTYDLNDLVVVEGDEEKKSDFKGFLSNLGNEITASLADKVQKQKTIDVENNITVVFIEKNQVFPVTELQIIEGTNEINYIIEDSFTEEIRLTMEDSKDQNFDSDEISPLDTDSDEEVIELSLTDAEEYQRNNEYSEQDTEDVITVRLEDLMQDQRLNQAINLDKFVIEDEGNEISQTCEFCGKSFRNKRLLRSHKHRSHSQKQYVCDLCGHKNNTLSAYKHHQNKHTGKRWVCEVCLKTYYTKSVLKVHMETHINQRKHLCSICGKSFNYANALSYHMRLHTGEKKYQCSTCGQRFRMPNSLKRHVRIHTGERPYLCQFCDRAFSSSGEMVAHEMIHTGVRPFTCKYCLKGFIKSHNLKVHMLSHRGPYLCQTCGKSFAEKSILVMHCRISHKQVVQDLLQYESDNENVQCVLKESFD